MAVNRFMKPAEQPLLNTYVRLPFKEMSMAYAQVQKEHDAGEKLNDSLDDEILKVRASTNQHSTVLGGIRKGLDAELSALYDKHGGRYADMVPELTKIKNKLDLDFNDGNLYAIKETTRALEEDLDPDIAKARKEGNYSEDYNPLFGAERDWFEQTHFGYKRVEDENSPSGYKWEADNESTDGWKVNSTGQTVLAPYTYAGIHKPSKQIKTANEQIFNPIKASWTKWTEENPDTGITVMNERKAITRQKIYKSALENYTYLPNNMQLEIDAEVQMMGEKGRMGSATHAINAVFGDPPAMIQNPDGEGMIENPMAEAKKNALQKIKDDPNSLNQWASADYVGYMGEKYTFTGEAGSRTYDNSQRNNNKYPIDKSDWVVKIGAESSIQAGTVRTQKVDGNELISDLDDPIDKYVNIVNDNSVTYESLVREYEATKGQYTLNDPYHKEWQSKIDNAKFQYEQSSMALIGLTQQAAKDMGVLETPQGLKYMNKEGRYVYVDRVLPDGTINPDWNMHGWNAIQFDTNGEVQNVEQTNRDAKGPQDNIFKYMDQSKGLFNNVSLMGGSEDSPLMNRVNVIQSNNGYFDGRSVQAPTVSSSGSKKVDVELVKKLPTILGQADTEFTLTNGSKVKWADIIGTGKDKIKKDVVDDFLQGKFKDNFVWLTQPTPDGEYLGILTLPKDSKDSNDTIDLIFKAPDEVRRTWRNQGEFERPLGDGSGMTEMVTLPRTEAQKQNWDANERGSIDFARASRSPGNISMSSAEDGENNPLGYYYFNQNPDGTPIANEQYIFQPQAGLIKTVINGEPVYTTGKEVFNVDSDMQDIGMLITLNDPTYAGSKAFYANEFKQNPNPIAREGVPVNVASEARGIDVSGEYFSTNLRPGQVMLPEQRVNDVQMSSYNTNNGWTFNNGFEGLNKQTADILAYQSKAYGEQRHNDLSSTISSKFKNTDVTMSDGSTQSFTTLLNNGDLELVPVSSVNGEFSLPLSSGARSFAQQKNMYDDWVSGGKVGPPVANPEEGGFHVMGQAIDLDNTVGMYDYILVDKTGNISSIGTNTKGAHTTSEGYDRTNSTRSGFKVSELTGASGNKIFPDYFNTSLTSLFDHMGKTPQVVKDMHKSSSVYREADPLPNMKQFDKEWWHWSLGELTGASSGYVYPSWAK